MLQAPPSGGPTLPNGARWNCNLKEYSNTYDQNDKPVIASDAFMMQDLGKDKYAIAYSGIHEKTNQVKALALAAKDGAPYIPFTLETVANRTYGGLLSARSAGRKQEDELGDRVRVQRRPTTGRHEL